MYVVAVKDVHSRVQHTIGARASVHGQNTLLQDALRAAGSAGSAGSAGAEGAAAVVVASSARLHAPWVAAP